MNETMLKYAKLMIENGEEHLRRIEEWITMTDTQLEEAREKRDQVILDMEELNAQLPDEPDEPEDEEESSDEE